VGHQIVINGFTWNSETRQGTFHIVNSWAELPEFDLKTEAAKGGALMIQESLCPKGEAPPEVVHVLEQSRACRKRLRLYYGDAATGRGLVGVARPFIGVLGAAYNLQEVGDPDFAGTMGTPVQPDVITIP
jgi:hypothetical protein